MAAVFCGISQTFHTASKLTYLCIHAVGRMKGKMNKAASQTVVAALLLLLSYCCNTNVGVHSFQFRSTSIPTQHGLPASINKIHCKTNIRQRHSHLSSSTTTTNEESFASTWMQNEKRIEDQMDNAAKSAATLDESKEQSTIDEANLPFGKWEYIHGNYILRPPSDDNKTNQTPRALIHFLGGALLGAAPQLTYRYLLERLARKGYLIVATPYQLSFDHLRSCDEIIDKFERGEWFPLRCCVYHVCGRYISHNCISNKPTNKQ